MNRKQLTATQILHGARAYSHNASRRAHQLSGPKRVRVMHGPVGNAALNDGIDNPCQHCGFQICNCGPCATCGEVPYYCSGTHAYEPPKPSARALDNLGAEPARAFRVGDRVRGRGASSGEWRDGVVLERYVGSTEYSDGLTPLLADDGSRPFVVTATIEAVAPAEPSPAGGRDPYEAAGHPWARVGMLVRFKQGGSVQRVLAPAHGDLHRVPLREYLWTLAEYEERPGYAHTSFVEPAPSPVSEAPAVESDPIAECERLGMWFTESAGGQGWNVRANVFIAVRHADNITDKTDAARAALEAWSRRGPAQ